MYDYVYTCPVCKNEVNLMGCPFDNHIIGQCKFCNLKIDILEEDYEEWKKEKEAKSDGR